MKEYFKKLQEQINIEARINQQLNGKAVVRLIGKKYNFTINNN